MVSQVIGDIERQCSRQGDVVVDEANRCHNR